MDLGALVFLFGLDPLFGLPMDPQGYICGFPLKDSNRGRRVAYFVQTPQFPLGVFSGDVL